MLLRNLDAFSALVLVEKTVYEGGREYLKPHIIRILQVSSVSLKFDLVLSS